MMDDRECLELAKRDELLSQRIDELEEKFDQIMMQINRITFMCYGAVGFFILSEIGFIQTLKL
jgi:hypothetical protein